jgi:hypothetical protein
MAISSLSLLMVKPAIAQIPTPSVPEFTLKYVHAENISLNPSNVPYDTVAVEIKNQNFKPYTDSSTNSTISLYYNVEVKLPKQENWTDIYTPGNYPLQSARDNPLMISNPENVTILVMPGPIPINQAVANHQYLPAPENYSGNYLSAGDQAEFRVQAIIENLTELNIPQPVPSWFVSTWGEPLTTPEWTTLAASDWSSTQTVTLPADYSSNSSLFHPPTVPEFSWLILLPLFIFLLSIAVTVRSRRKSE